MSVSTGSTRVRTRTGSASPKAKSGYNPVKPHLAMMHKYPDFVGAVQRNRDDNESVDIPE
jgi:hypothetical protein